MDEKKKTEWKRYIGIFIVFLVEMIGYIIALKYINFFENNFTLIKELTVILGVLLGMQVAKTLNVIIHEAGHLVFGMLSGYQFSSFRVFSLMWIKKKGKIKLKKLKIAGTAGQCLMVPPDIKNNKIPYVLYNLGGGIMNAIVSTIFLMIFFICIENKILSILILFFVVEGYKTVIENLIPLHIGDVDNDGYNVIALKKNPEAIKAFWTQMKIVEQNAKGIRLKDMPEEWFYIPSDNSMKNNMIATIGVFTCNKLIDEQKIDEADKLMERLLEIDSEIAGLHRKLLICDRIYIELIRDNRPEKIKEMLTEEQIKFMKSMKNYPSVLRTEYALSLLYEKNTTKAEEIKNQFEECVKNYPYSNDIISERELMELLKKKVIDS